MSKRMLIDDTHEEETRVVIINGNKLEDVEFETSSRRQIKGNVYLAKVMRVEPSLQAAFVDYGGNKHGFLAFSEIHPDYYNISDEKLAAIDKEVDDIIEAKKQAIKEREQGRDKMREERAAKREAFLKEKEKQEASKKASEENSDASVMSESAEGKDQQSLDTSLQSEAEKNAAEKKSTEKSDNRAAKRTRRKPKAVSDKTDNKDALNQSDAEGKEAEKPVVEETHAKAEIDVSEEVSEDTAEDISEDAKPLKKRLAKKRFKKKINQKDKVKVLAESAGTDEESLCEEVDEVHSKKHSENIVGEEVVDDDEDDDDDFELQRKLMKARKLYHSHNIKDVIKEGQILLIQVVKEERGNKGAALTTYLSLAGRYCVLMPNRIKSGGVSRKITNASDRKRLKEIIRELPLTSDMSMIVRTAGEEKSKPDIVRDYNYLMRSWNQIRIEALKNKAPALVHEEGNLIKRALRDMYTKDISEIIVDGDRAFREARDFTRILSPHNLKKIKSTKRGDIPLFQRFQVESQLDKLHDTNVQLESGGYLVINPTEALVAIDVNSGRATKEKDLEETALKTNLEAADEIARQLKMRNLAGLVVIDFIDMDEPKNNQAIERRMKEALKNDRARIQIGKMSCFGLLEISRQRLHSSFLESSYQTCPHCQGKGLIRTIESSAVLVLRDIEEECIKNRSARLNIFVPTDVAIYVLNQKRQAISEMESRYGIQVVISADDSIKNIADYRVDRTKQVKNQTPTPISEPEEIKEEEIEEKAFVEESEEKSYERRDRNRRDRRGRRNRFDRGNRREKHENNYENKSKSETVMLYNSHGDNSGSSEEDKKGKASWWKKLIS